MSESALSTQLRGDIVPWASSGNCRVALADGETEYPVLPRGAGMDLADMVGSQVEVTCVIQDAGPDAGEGDGSRLLVRSYVVLDGEDDAWAGDA